MKKRYKTNKTDCNNQYYMYGHHPILTAIQNKQRKIHKIYCLKKQENKYRTQLLNIDIPLQIIKKDFIIQKIGHGHTHQGIIALVNSVFKYNITTLTFAPQQDTIILLDQITDPQNIGAIIRSAAAFGINKLILTNNKSPKENAVIAKTACGSLEFVQVAKVQNINSTIRHLKQKGFWIVGLDAMGQENIGSIININKIAIIIGTESKGIRKLISHNCDFLVNIPMSKYVPSLNASNAASIIFYLISIKNNQSY
jgi:23S rRNA (guanosine2251-2'-O)-methyltransferase